MTTGVETMEPAGVFSTQKSNALSEATPAVVYTLTCFCESLGCETATQRGVDPRGTTRIAHCAASTSASRVRT